jgi:hypothetical protein
VFVECVPNVSIFPYPPLFVLLFSSTDCLAVDVIEARLRLDRFNVSTHYQERFEQAATTLAMFEKLTASHYWMYAMQKAQDPNDKEFQACALRLVTDYARGPRIANTPRDDANHPVLSCSHLHA